ncbi:MAG: class I SAM-dependent methyltransferase, partial [Deltaproteobacteria bacterium]|nr:class I SAM-dependent methyltransferase [Deltaproteobacteria bacterium]
MLEMIKSCAICEPQTPSFVLYPATLNIHELNEQKWSARKIPDGTHHQMHRCLGCGLIFSSPIVDLEKINVLYRDSAYTYKEEIENLKLTYGYYLQKISPLLSSKDCLLEIGCGSGFFLEKALEMGFKKAYGIEPSLKAVDQALPDIKQNIYTGMFQDRLYPSK